MSDGPITVRYFVHKKDDPDNKFCIDITYDSPAEKEEADRTFGRYLVDHHLNLFAGPIAHKELVRREAEWAEHNRQREERSNAYDARQAALRTMGEDYDLYDFSDFSLGDDLEQLLDDDSGNDADQEKQEARITAITGFLKECIDKMRTEGEWRYHFEDWKKLEGGRFVWEPKLWADFWCGDGFPFTLDFRPHDIVPALLEEVADLTEGFEGETVWDESVAEKFDDMEATLECWMKAFADAIVTLRNRADELKKQPVP
jgi:hypothetical protein